MEKMNELMRDYLAAEDEQSRANEAASEAKEKLNREMMTCGPFKISDIVPVTGYSYTDRKMIVDHLWIGQGHIGFGVWGVIAKGRVIKADGTPGLQEAEHFVEVGVAPEGYKS